MKREPLVVEIKVAIERDEWLDRIIKEFGEDAVKKAIAQEVEVCVDAALGDPFTGTLYLDEGMKANIEDTLEYWREKDEAERRVSQDPQAS